jgi:hypothetical protein
VARTKQPKPDKPTRDPKYTSERLIDAAGWLGELVQRAVSVGDKMKEQGVPSITSQAEAAYERAEEATKAWWRGLEDGFDFAKRPSAADPEKKPTKPHPQTKDRRD